MSAAIVLTLLCAQAEILGHALSKALRVERARIETARPGGMVEYGCRERAERIEELRCLLDAAPEQVSTEAWLERARDIAHSLRTEPYHKGERTDRHGAYQNLLEVEIGVMAADGVQARLARELIASGSRSYAALLPKKPAEKRTAQLTTPSASASP